MVLARFSALCGLVWLLVGCDPSAQTSTSGGGLALGCDDPYARCADGGADGGSVDLCGDAVCSIAEDAAMTCPTDCSPVCGNGVCEAGEGDTTFCPACTNADPPCAAPCWTHRCIEDCTCGTSAEPGRAPGECSVGLSCCNGTTCYDPEILRCLGEPGQRCGGACDCTGGLVCCAGTAGGAPGMDGGRCQRHVECTAPRAGCTYVGATPCTCGQLVCDRPPD